MTENRKKILEMLSQNKITAEDAYRLLNVIDAEESGGESDPKTETDEKANPKYLRVTVLPGAEGGNENTDRVNVRVPMSLIRAGIKLTSLIPSRAVDKMNDSLREKGIDFDLHSIKPGDLEELIEALSELEVDVQDGKEKVRVYVE